MNTRHLFLACALCIPLGLSAQNMFTTGSATSLGANTYQLTPAAVEIRDNGIDDNCDGLVDILVYCTPSVIHPCEFLRITNVTLADINNSSGCGAGGYTDFRALSASLEPGATYTISISGDGYLTMFASVYVDWNRDGDFEDSGEKIATLSYHNDGYPGFANISIPGNATGSYTMRVIADIYPVQDPCSIEYGEAEDYTIQVTPLCPDMDGDGYYPCHGDCDDDNPAINAGAIEIFDNSIDDNCDGLVDIPLYCTPSVSYPCEFMWITNVTLDDIDNSSGCGPGGYADFTALSASLDAGATYTISISGNYPMRASVYVDWNRDGDFEDSEENITTDIFLQDGYPGSANISIPDNATGGSYTMRVIADFYFSVPNPCSIDWGEAEDYTIQVTPSCQLVTYYADSDGDGYGNLAVSTAACAAPNGFVANNGDCDDGDASIKPGAAELCDGKDNDCDGQIDETVAISSPWTAVNVGAEAQGSSWFDCTNGGTFTLNAKGYTTNTIDVQHSVYQTLCGNGDIIARVASISTQGGWAGIQMRESASQGAKKFTLKTQLNTNNRREVRTVTNGPTTNLQIQRPFTYNWLRITRSGNVFAAYLSVDGVNWGQPVSSTTMTMNSCIQVGLFVESTNNTITTQATFNNVFISGGNQPLAEAPITQDVPDMEMAHEVSLFPNPSTGELNVDLPSYAGRAVRLEIYSLQGRLLHFAEIQEVQTIERLDLSAYPSGMYLLKVKSEGLPDVVKRVVRQ